MSDMFEFIDAEYAASYQNETQAPSLGPSIVQMCAWTGVSRSGYYDWRNKPESATVRRRDELKVLIVHFHIELRHNSRRRHSGLGYETPQQVRTEFETRQLAA